MWCSPAWRTCCASRKPARVTEPAPSRRRHEAHLVVRLGLLIGLLGVLGTGTPPPEQVLALLLLAGLLALSALRPVGSLTVLALLGVGLLLRSIPSAGYSDVLAVTSAAIGEMLAGGSPYGHGLEASTPPGAPFAYGPLALLWYLPSLDDPGRMEWLASLVVLVTLAVRGRILGLAVFAVTPALVVAAGDGSNDSSAGLMILAALLLSLRAPLAGAVLLALAAAFKPYALAWLPGLLAYAGGPGPLVGFLAASAIAWLPAAWLWGLDSLLWSFRRAEQVHALPYYSLAYGLRGRLELPAETWTLLRFSAGALLALASLLAVRSSRSLVILGSLVFLATLYLGWWSTFAYLAAIAPVACWHLDEWLGLEGGRVRWPGDPVARISVRVDGRLPAWRS